MSVQIQFNATQVLHRKGGGHNYLGMKRFIANEFVRLTDPFVPFREGYLKNSATIANDGSFVQYSMPYARRLYYGTSFNFKGAPQRGALWGERSMAINHKAIEKATQRAMDRGLF